MNYSHRSQSLCNWQINQSDDLKPVYSLHARFRPTGDALFLFPFPSHPSLDQGIPLTWNTIPAPTINLAGTLSSVKSHPARGNPPPHPQGLNPALPLNSLAIHPKLVVCQNVETDFLISNKSCTLHGTPMMLPHGSYIRNPHSSNSTVQHNLHGTSNRGHQSYQQNPLFPGPSPLVVCKKFLDYLLPPKLTCEGAPCYI